jgi:hypothetical protein
MKTSTSSTPVTLSIAIDEINKDAKDLCNHLRAETGDIYYQSDIEDMISDLLSDCFEQIAIELPRLLKDGSDRSKSIDLSLIIKRAQSKLVAVDNDRLFAA